MKRGFGIIIGVLLCIGTIFVLKNRNDGRQLVYQGKLLSYWVWTLWPKSAQELPTDQLSVIAIRSFGTNAIPYLVSKLKYYPPDWYEARVLGLRRILWQSGLYRPSSGQLSSFEWRFAAQQALYLLGEDARTAIPAYREMLDNPLTAPDAIKLLTYSSPAKNYGPIFGAEGFDVLLKACTNRSPDIRTTAVGAIGLMNGHEDQTRQKILMEAANDPEPLVRARAMSSLCGGSLKAYKKDSLPTLYAGLRDANAQVRRFSALRFSLMKGPPEAIPALSSLTNDTDATVKEMAIKAIESIQAENQ